MDSERLMTPKTDYLLTEGEESISMDFQVCQPQKTRVLCLLNDEIHLFLMYSARLAVKFFLISFPEFAKSIQNVV